MSHLWQAVRVDGAAGIFALCVEGCSYIHRNDWNQRCQRTVSASQEPSRVKEAEGGGDFKSRIYMYLQDLESDRPGFEP